MIVYNDNVYMMVYNTEETSGCVHSPRRKYCCQHFLSASLVLRNYSQLSFSKLHNLGLGYHPPREQKKVSSLPYLSAFIYILLSFNQ